MPEQIQEVPQTPQPTQPVQPVPVEPKKKSSFKIIVILLVVILLVASGVYAGMQLEKKKVKVWTEPPLTVVTPQPTEISDATANWKTYSNTKYNFSIKYPSVFNIKSEDWEHTSAINTGTLVGAVNFVQGNLNDRMTLAISSTKTSLDANGVAKLRCGGSFGDKLSLCTLVEKPIIPDSLQYFDNAHYRSINTIFTYNNLLFEIELSDNNPDRPFTKDEVDMYDQILSTFKFMDQKITKEQAAELVTKLDEVKNWLSLFSGPDQTSPKTGGRPVIAFDNMEGDDYIIHVYEVVQDSSEESHNATFNWYRVNSLTGEIKKEFK